MVPSYRLLPEFTPVKEVLLALPCAGGDWQANLAEALACYARIIKSILQHDSSVGIRLLAFENADWVNQLPLTRAERERTEVNITIPYNDTWVRDYGPLSFTDQGEIIYRAFEFNGWGGKYPAATDNAVASALDLRPFEKRKLVLEGGALEINADGVLLVNQACIVDEARNPGLSMEHMEVVLKKELGALEVEWLADIQLEGDDTDGHIDTLARFVKNDVLVCCGEAPQHHDAKYLSSLVWQLKKICEKRNWQLHQLPVPIVKSKLDGRLLPATYANFLICNKNLFIPVYGVTQDQQAVNILQKILPDMNVVPIRSEALLEQHGSLHCATMQLA